jgi:hypothetical protein
MQLAKEFLIGDIWDYEINNVNILEELGQLNLFMVIDLIEMGNKCDAEMAESLLNKYLKEMTLEQIAEELTYEVIGNKPSENKEDNIENKWTTFSDVLWSFFNQLQSLDSNLSISEFRSMSTKSMYKYAEGVKERYINSMNLELEKIFVDKVMLGQSMSGKLKECPRLDPDGSLHKETLQEKLLKLKAGGK